MNLELMDRYTEFQKQMAEAFQNPSYIKYMNDPEFVSEMLEEAKYLFAEIAFCFHYTQDESFRSHKNNIERVLVYLVIAKKNLEKGILNYEVCRAENN